jgi:hypothetical protein
VIMASFFDTSCMLFGGSSILYISIEVLENYN